MSTRTESTVIEYEGDSAGAVRASQQANASLDTVEKKAGGVGSAFANLGGIISGALATAGGMLISKGLDVAGDFLNDALGEARDNAQGQAELTQALANTAAQTGVTAAMVNDLAGEMQLLTKFSDDEIVSAGTVLARFKEIGKDIFPDTTKAALDLASVLKIDTAAAAKLLGKALAEPGEGLARLKAAGIVFTDEQEKVIKSLFDTGNAAEAQRMILDHLNKTIGGTAEAMGKTPEGQAAIFENMVNDIKQAVGDVLLPFLNSAMSTVIAIFRNPAVQAGIAGLADALAAIGAGVQQFFTFLGAGDAGELIALRQMLVGVFGPEIGGMIVKIAETINSFFFALSEGWSPLEAIGFLLNDIFGAGTSDMIQAFAGGLVSAIQGVFATIQGVFQGFTGWIQSSLAPALSSLGEIISTNVLPFLERLGGGLNTHVVPALQAMGGWLNANVVPALREFAGLIGLELQAQLALLGTNIILVLGHLGTFTTWLFGTGIPALEVFGGVINTVVNEAIQTFSDIWLGIVKGFEDAVGFVGETRAGLLDLADAINTEVGAAFTWLKDTLLDPLLKTFGGLVAAAEGFLFLLQQIAGLIPTIDLGPFMPGSPSPFELSLGRTNKHLREMLGILPDSLGAMASFRTPTLGAYGGMNGGAMQAQTVNHNLYNHGTLNIGIANLDELIPAIEDRLMRDINARARNRE